MVFVARALTFSAMSKYKEKIQRELGSLMISELCQSSFILGRIYFYFTEGKGYAKNPEDAKGEDCLTSLGRISNYLDKIKGTSEIVKTVVAWKKKIEDKYSVGQKLDASDCKELGDAAYEWYSSVVHLVLESDSEQKTLESIAEGVKKVQESVAPILDNVKGYISSFQSATLSLVESSPAVRTLEPAVRGLLNRSGSGEIILAGYFDQYLLTDFQSLNPKPLIKFISPELTNSKQDQINLDALQRLESIGAQVRFHPMLHARLVLSPTEIIVGSADIKSDCMGGRRYDLGMWSNSPALVQSGKVFVDKVWNESKPLT